MELEIRSLESPLLVELWREAFCNHNYHRPDEYYTRCMEENRSGERVTLLALVEGRLAGCAHLKYQSEYSPFAERGIPEINDLNVFPAYRRQGIADRLLAEFETIAARSGPEIGIGVGLFASYGAAQRLYCRRGYLPDGLGVSYEGRLVEPGEMVRVDDDLNLFFTKRLSADE